MTETRASSDLLDWTRTISQSSAIAHCLGMPGSYGGNWEMSVGEKLSLNLSVYVPELFLPRVVSAFAAEAFCVTGMVDYLESGLSSGDDDAGMAAECKNDLLKFPTLAFCSGIGTFAERAMIWELYAFGLTTEGQWAWTFSPIKSAGFLGFPGYTASRVSVTIVFPSSDLAFRQPRVLASSTMASGLACGIFP